MKNYSYNSNFMNQNTQKSDVEGHIVTKHQIWKGMQRKFFMFNPLPQSKNSNHKFYNSWPINISKILSGKNVK